MSAVWIWTVPGKQNASNTPGGPPQSPLSGGVAGHRNQRSSAVSNPKDLQIELQGKLSGGITDIADNVQQMGKIIDLKIRNSRTILKDKHELFAEIAERRANVFRDLQDAFNKFMNKSENFSQAEIFPGNESLSPQIAGGAGIGIVGVVLLPISKVAVFDVTGGVVAGLGFLFAGGLAFFQKRTFMDAFKNEITNGRSELEVEVRNKLNDYIVNIRKKIESSFNDFDGLLQYEETYDDLTRAQKKIFQSSYTFIEYSFFAFLFWKNIKSPGFKKLIIGASIFFLVFQITYYFKSKLKRLDSIPIGSETIFIFIFIFYFFYECSKRARAFYIYSQYCFWVSVGALIYLGGSFFFYILMNELDQEQVDNFGILTYMAEILKNLFLQLQCF